MSKYNIIEGVQYKCKHFAIHELVPKHIYEKFGERAWMFLNPRMCVTLDRLRGRYGRCRMNSYHWGKADHWRGLRTPESRYYSETSQHSYGNAADPIFHSVSAEQIRQDMIDHPDWDCFEFITSIELGVSWFHFDVRNVDAVLKFKP